MTEEISNLYIRIAFQYKSAVPSLRIRTRAVGMRGKTGQRWGISAYPEIAADFHLWLDSAERSALVGTERNRKADYSNPQKYRKKFKGVFL